MPRIPMQVVGLDAGVYPTQMGTQITEAGAPSIGTQDCLAGMIDGGADIGFFVRFVVPQNYVGSPQVIVHGVIDGTPAAGAVLAFLFRKRAVASNESADGTFDAEQLVEEVIGSSGTNHADEDEYSKALPLTAGDYSPGDTVYGYLAIDANENDYTGQFLATNPEFDYA